jgi:hypothetical protein
MLSAIDFDDQHSLATNKITGVVFNRHLPNEFMPVDLPIANPIPEDRFRVGLVDAQTSRDPDGFFVVAPHCPPLTRIAARSDLSPQSAGRG